VIEKAGKEGSLGNSRAKISVVEIAAQFGRDDE
jgi:hypothetical protein